MLDLITSLILLEASRTSYMHIILHANKVRIAGKMKPSVYLGYFPFKSQIPQEPC